MEIPAKESQNRALIIINPTAGIQPVNFIVKKDLDRRKNKISLCESLSKQDTECIVRDNFDTHDIFIAAGGDGTVHSVATQLVGTNKIFGVLPLGSGNGFAKEFGFKMNIHSLLSEIQKAESVDTDVIEINDKLCLNVAGIGLDSFVAHSFNDLKLR